MGVEVRVKPREPGGAGVRAYIVSVVKELSMEERVVVSWGVASR